MRKIFVNSLICLFLLAMAVEVPAEDGQTHSQTSCAGSQQPGQKKSSTDWGGNPVSPMPEPGAALLFSLGGVGLLIRQRHQRLKRKGQRQG